MMNRTKEAIRETGNVDESNQAIFEAICRDAAEALDADLVSIWKFQSDPERIECIFALDVTADATSSGQSLLQSDFPVYFQSIVEENIVCAPDAWTHSMTKELAEPYFKPHGVVSLLDFIVHHNFKPSGIICCESREKRRDWSETDREFLRTLATLASFRTRI